MKTDAVNLHKYDHLCDQISTFCNSLVLLPFVTKVVNDMGLVS